MAQVDEGGADVFARMVNAFTKEVDDLRSMVPLRDADADVVAMLEQLDARLTQAETKLAQVQQVARKEKAAVAQAEQLCHAMYQQAEKLEKVQSNLPARLPGDQAVRGPAAAATGAGKTTAVGGTAGNGSSSSSQVRGSSRGRSSTASLAAASPRQAAAARVRRSTVAPRARRSRVPEAMPSLAGEVIHVPTVAYVSVDELASIPSYMKGRLTQEKVNAAVDEVNELVSAKYQLLSRPVSTLSDSALRKYKLYKDAETADTKDQVFFCDSDMRGLKTIKADATGRSVIQVMRHLGRLREVRDSDKIIRYIVRE